MLRATEALRTIDQASSKRFNSSISSDVLHQSQDPNTSMSYNMNISFRKFLFLNSLDRCKSPSTSAVLDTFTLFGSFNTCGSWILTCLPTDSFISILAHHQQVHLFQYLHVLQVSHTPADVYTPGPFNRFISVDSSMC